MNTNDSIPPTSKEATHATPWSPNIFRSSFLHRGASVVVREHVAGARRSLPEVSSGTRHRTIEDFGGAGNEVGDVARQSSTASNARDKSRTTSWGAVSRTTGSHSSVQQPNLRGRSETMQAGFKLAEKHNTRPSPAVSCLRKTTKPKDMSGEQNPQPSDLALMMDSPLEAILKKSGLDSGSDGRESLLSPLELDDEFADLITTMDIRPKLSPTRSGARKTSLFDRALEETWETILSDDEDEALNSSQFTKILLRDIESKKKVLRFSASVKSSDTSSQG